MFCRIAQIAEAVRRADRIDSYKVCPRYAEFGNAILHFFSAVGQESEYDR